MFVERLARTLRATFDRLINRSEPVQASSNWVDDVDALKTNGELDLAGAETLLGHPNPDARALAARRLGELAKPQSLKPLLRALRRSREKTEAKRGANDRENEFQFAAVTAIGALAGASELATLWKCLPLRRHRPVYPDERDAAEDAMCEIAARDQERTRRWLARLRPRSTEESRVRAMLLAAAGAPGAFEALSDALEHLGRRDGPRARLVGALAALADPRSVPILLSQTDGRMPIGGLYLEGLLEKLLPRVIGELSLDTLYALATTLPFSSNRFRVSMRHLQDYALMDQVRRTALGELESRGASVPEAAEPPLETPPEFLRLYNELLPRTFQERDARREGNDLRAISDESAGPMEAEMQTFIERAGDSLSSRDLTLLLKMPVGRDLVSAVVDQLRDRLPGARD